MTYSVTIDCFPESAALYREDHAIIAIDVIRATTSAVTALATGRRCFPVENLQSARHLARRLHNPLLCGELGGLMPTGFDINNSPAELHNRSDIDRPLVLLSSSGTKLMCNARNSDGTYIACFRNAAATAAYVAGRHPKVAVIGAGSRGDFRIEDQICCAWITGTLVEAGYSVLDKKTAEIMNRFRHVGADACIDGDSAHYLRRSGQIRDLDFILRRVDDLSCVAMLAGDELIEATTEDVMTEKVVLSAH